MRKAFGFILATIFSSTILAQNPVRQLNLDENYTVDIILTGNAESGIIQLLLKVNTTGYVGFGLSNSPNMTDADLFIGGVYDDGNTTYGKDYHAKANQMPIEDPENYQNWWLMRGDETEGQTILMVTRNLYTYDTDHDVYIENSDIYVLWSYGETDTIIWHGDEHRGSRFVNLFSVDDSTEVSSTTPESSSSNFGMSIASSVHLVSLAVLVPILLRLGTFLCLKTIYSEITRSTIR